MKNIIFLIVLCLTSVIAFSQNEKNTDEIAIVARAYKDKIVLRYFATNPILFNVALKNGYSIEKSIPKSGVANEKLSFKPLIGSPFKRLSENKMEEIFKITKDTNDLKLAGLAISLTDSNAKVKTGDVLNDGLKSLKQKQEEADMKFGFAVLATAQSKLAAELLGLRIEDQDVVPGTSYVYRIKINSMEKDSKYYYLEVKCQDFNAKYLENNKSVNVVENDQKIDFSFPSSKEYYAFKVWRSDNGGQTFKNLTPSPEITLKPKGYSGKTGHAYSDSGLVNYKKYKYKVMVSTVFGDDLLLSEFVATPRDKTPPIPPFLKSAKHIKPNQVELSWEMIGEPAKDLKGFNIKRGTESKGRYDMISKNMLSKSTYRYIDETFIKEGDNYYVVEALDTAGNISQSFPAYVTLIDSIPPAAPIISSAIIDSLGKIIIKIKPNTEKDFMGYELQKSNSKDHEFSIIHQTFKDSLGFKVFVLYDSTTLNTLTKKIYYKVIAFDTHFNQSIPSNIIELTKRDTIPPVPAILTNFIVKDSSIVLTFANSTSEDVISNTLLRREKGQSSFSPIFVNKNKLVTKYIDYKVAAGKTYEYTMTSKDESGLTSKMSRNLLIKTPINNKLPTPSLTGIYDAKSKSISLSIKADPKLKGKKIFIEISKRGNTKDVWNALKPVELDKTKVFSDIIIPNSDKAYYIIRLIGENGKQSNYSKPLEIIIKK